MQHRSSKFCVWANLHQILVWETVSKCPFITHITGIGIRLLLALSNRGPKQKGLHNAIAALNRQAGVPTCCWLSAIAASNSGLCEGPTSLSFAAAALAFFFFLGLASLSGVGTSWMELRPWACVAARPSTNKILHTAYGVHQRKVAQTLRVQQSGQLLELRLRDCIAATKKVEPRIPQLL
eukprot:1157298-Pelagomonas_calceolata.AAC.26